MSHPTRCARAAVSNSCSTPSSPNHSRPSPPHPPSTSPPPLLTPLYIRLPVSFRRPLLLSTTPPLPQPPQVVAIYKKPTLSSALSGAFMSKTCDLVAGCYRFSANWGVDEQPLMVRRRVEERSESSADHSMLVPEVMIEADQGLIREGSEGEGGEREVAEVESAGQALEWGPWQRAKSKGGVVLLDEPDAGEEVMWQRNLNLDVEVLPVYRYLPGTELHLLRDGRWVRMVVERQCERVNVYSGHVDGVYEPCIELVRRNHAPLLEPSMALHAEYLKYLGWVRSTYAFVVDALSGERLDIMCQCVKLQVEGGGDEHDALELVMHNVCSDAGQPVMVIGEAASGKSTFARLFLSMCMQQAHGMQLVPFLVTTIDLVRAIKQNNLSGDYLDGYLRTLYGPSSRQYVFLKQAMLERRLVLFFDGMDEVRPHCSVISGYKLVPYHDRSTTEFARIILPHKPYSDPTPTSLFEHSSTPGVSKSSQALAPPCKVMSIWPCTAPHRPAPSHHSYWVESRPFSLPGAHGTQVARRVLYHVLPQHARSHRDDKPAGWVLTGMARAMRQHEDPPAGR